jgi:hypothetical protein
MLKFRTTRLISGNRIQNKSLSNIGIGSEGAKALSVALPNCKLKCLKWVFKMQFIFRIRRTDSREQQSCSELDRGWRCKSAVWCFAESKLQLERFDVGFASFLMFLTRLILFLKQQPYEKSNRRGRRKGTVYCLKESKLQADSVGVCFREDYDDCVKTNRTAQFSF